jgi:uncharacterized protein YegJ (DUF2314 family)
MTNCPSGYLFVNLRGEPLKPERYTSSQCVTIEHIPVVLQSETAQQQIDRALAMVGNMKNHFTLSLVFLILSCCSCSKSPNTLIKGGYDEKEMDAAIARARSEVDSFIAEMLKGNGTDFAVKVPIQDKEDTEHFWLTNIVYRNGKFEGVIGNEPGIVTNVKSGQKWTVKKSEISDWMFMRDGKMYGNYTMRPLLKTMSEGEAAKFRSILANP